MAHPPTTSTLLETLDTRILEALPNPAAPHDPALSEFYRLIGDYPARGGKRMRGLVVLLSTAAHGANWEMGLSAATALELFQNWVLIHDDIEDDSDQRRGRPSLHKQVGMPVALNVGDALHVYMWQQLHSLDELEPEWQQQVVREFEWTISRTAEGQHLDLSWVRGGRFDISEADYLRMVTLKTAYYTVVSPLRLGALCAGCWPSPLLREAGENLGVTFQIRDDVLNLTPEVSYGKEFAGDLYEAKRTLILAHLFATAGSAEKAALEEALSKPRQLRTEQDIELVLDAIRRHGSLTYAQSVAEAKAKRGLELLAEALDDLPDHARVLELTRLFQAIARRSQ